MVLLVDHFILVFKFVLFRVGYKEELPEEAGSSGPFSGRIYRLKEVGSSGGSSGSSLSALKVQRHWLEGDLVHHFKIVSGYPRRLHRENKGGKRLHSTWNQRKAL